MIAESVILTQDDKQALALLEDFLPGKIFDMHMHIGSARFSPGMWRPGNSFSRCGETITMERYGSHMGQLFGDREYRGNMIICPDEQMAEAKSENRTVAVQFLAQQLEKYPDCVGELPVGPADTVEELENMLIHPRIIGFKCYHLATGKPDSFQREIGEYLPESAWQVADQRGLCITLHMVRDLALADPENMAYIKQMAIKYPNAKLILAHAARSFAAWTTMETAEQLAQYPNVYFDLSAVCEPGAIFEIIRKCGHKRVFWGSDYPIAMNRGKCVSIGAGFLWLLNAQLSDCTGDGAFPAYLVGVENLLAVRAACKMLDLDRKAVEDIFYNNAVELFDYKD